MKKLFSYIFITTLLVVITAQTAFASFDVRVSSSESSINFRPSPSTSSGVICEIPNNNVLTIYDIVRNDDLNWGYTEYNGTWGWISLRHTVTPNHNYSVPDYIREWDGTIAGADNGAVNDSDTEDDVRFQEMPEVQNGWNHLHLLMPDSDHPVTKRFYKDNKEVEVEVPSAYPSYTSSSEYLSARDDYIRRQEEAAVGSQIICPPSLSSL